MQNKGISKGKEGGAVEVIRRKFQGTKASIVPGIFIAETDQKLSITDNSGKYGFIAHIKQIWTVCAYFLHSVLENLFLHKQESMLEGVLETTTSNLSYNEKEFYKSLIKQ